MTYRTSNRVSCRIALVVSVVLLQACGQKYEDPSHVTSVLEGRVTVRAEVDSIPDYRGFELLVASADGRGDTLGVAQTDSTGQFSMKIVAPERGIYPLVISRRGTTVKRGQIVVAADDSATMSLRIPDGNRPLIIRSPENAAWLAYRNSKAVHNRELLALVRSGELTVDRRRMRFLQSADLLWGLQNQYPGTIGAEIAAAESVLMLEGIDDTLVVERASLLDPNSTAFVDVARVARRSEARLRGQDAALSLLRRNAARIADRERRASLVAEMVVAFVDSSQLDSALVMANELSTQYGDTPWAGWAKDASYEIENLMPGMEAPDFTTTTWTGQTFKLLRATDGLVLLEFVRPGDEIFRREMALRDSLIRRFVPDRMTLVTVSAHADSVINEAFFDESPEGVIQIVLPGGFQSEIARIYNVKSVPKRFLLQGGVIRAKYAGPAIESVLIDIHRALDEAPS